MKTLKLGAVALLIGSTLALAGCADDPYGRTYTSVGVGVSSGGGYGYRDRDFDGVPNRYDRDRDGDGVPNRYDVAPNNPWR